MTNDNEATTKTCFVMTPISDVEPYEPGHFGRVYEYIIKPACLAAGFAPIRADEVQMTNFIVIDILRKILEADIAVCDLSARNPNVFYELGIRQAFNRPVTLIKDTRTPRVFDIQGLRDIEYDENLRVDKIKEAVDALTAALISTSTMDNREVNSIVQLLGIKPAQVSSVEISKDTSIVLEAVKDISRRLSKLEKQRINLPTLRTPNEQAPFGIIRIGGNLGLLLGSKLIQEGDFVKHPRYGDGIVSNINDEMVSIRFDDNQLWHLDYRHNYGELLELDPVEGS